MQQAIYVEKEQTQVIVVRYFIIMSDKHMLSISHETVLKIVVSPAQAGIHTAEISTTSIRFRIKCGMTNDERLI